MNTYAALLAPDVEQLAEVVDRLPIGVIILSRPTGDVVYVNNAARRMLHPLTLRRGRGIPDRWPELSLPDYARRLLMKDAAPKEIVRADGGRAYVVSGIPPRRANVAVVLIEDVSEGERRRRAEQEFVANAAHELITPLTGLVGAAHVLEAGAKEVPEDRDRFIAHIADEAARLTRVARSLLVLARAQSGEEPPRLEVLALRPLVEEAVETVSGGNRDRYEFDCPEELTVLADADLLSQALANLVANAVRHAANTVTVQAAELQDNRIEIRVWDGDLRSVAVEPQQPRRFHSGAGRDGGGFGLGISIATQSITVMGGKLTVTRLRSGGVTARVELPAGRVARR